jgi:hypothetical protein
VAAKVTPSAIEKLASSMHPLRPAINELPAEIVASQEELEKAQLEQAEESSRGKIIKPGARPIKQPAKPTKKPATKPASRVARGQ